jgi:hypothetical protein
MENNLEKQFVPYLEPVINQTLDMVEEMFDKETFNGSEVNKLLNELQDGFGEYIHMISPEIQGRILEISYRLERVDKMYDLQNTPLNI